MKFYQDLGLFIGRYSARCATRSLRHFSRSLPFQRSSAAGPHVCIVGSGPAGFYTAQHLLKVHHGVKIDVYEKLPVPFGLARFGIAPDHPEMKNCINQFTSAAQNDRCSYIGNVNIGKDVFLSELRDAYDAVILSYGAESDKTFGLPGEDLHGVFGARAFVGWYNGLPKNANLKPDLNTDSVVVLGHGNVALDVARILLEDLKFLQKTDICGHAVEALRNSKVKTVNIIGRRGPLQVSFTIKELREMTKLAGCRPFLNPEDFLSIKELLPSIQRPRKRLIELMCKTALDTPTPEEQVRLAAAKKEWRLKFTRSPLQFLPSLDGTRVVGVRFGINRLERNSEGTVTAVPTGETEDIPCGMVLRSIGYKSLSIDDNLPFDSQRGVIKNTQGRVFDSPGLYCSGWVKSGPVGIIANTMNDAFDIAKTVAQDLTSGKVSSTGSNKGFNVIKSLLDERGVKTAKFSQWELIDAAEQSRGKPLGKPREKITSIQEMMNIAYS